MYVARHVGGMYPREYHLTQHLHIIHSIRAPAHLKLQLRGGDDSTVVVVAAAKVMLVRMVAMMVVVASWS